MDKRSAYNHAYIDIINAIVYNNNRVNSNNKEEFEYETIQVNGELQFTDGASAVKFLKLIKIGVAVFTFVLGLLGLFGVGLTVWYTIDTQDPSESNFWDELTSVHSKHQSEAGIFDGISSWKSKHQTESHFVDGNNSGSHSKLVAFKVTTEAFSGMH